MTSHMIVYTKYSSTSNDFGGGLEVSNFRVSKVGKQNSRLLVEFEGKGSVKRAWMFLEPEIAVPLARNLLSVAEGYLSKAESEVA